LLFLFFTGSTAPLGPDTWFFNFMIILQTVGPLGWVISSSQSFYLNTEQHKHRIHTYQTFMLSVGFKPTILAFKWAETVPASDRSAAVSGLLCLAFSYLRMKLNYYTSFRGLGVGAGRNFPTGYTVQGLCCRWELAQIKEAMFMHEFLQKRRPSGFPIPVVTWDFRVKMSLSFLPEIRTPCSCER
jgi:hypothetical protein